MLGVETGIDLSSPEVTSTLGSLKREWLGGGVTAWDKKMAEKVKQLELIHLQLLQAEAQLVRDIQNFKGAARSDKQQEVFLRIRVQELYGLKAKFYSNLQETQQGQQNPFDARMREVQKYEQAKDRMIQNGTYLGRDALIMEEMILKEKSKVKVSGIGESLGKQSTTGKQRLDETSDGRKELSNSQAISPPSNLKAGKKAGTGGSVPAVKTIEPEISLSQVGQTGRDPTPIPISVRSPANMDALAELQAELEKKEQEAEKLIQSIEKHNSTLRNRREQHQEFLKVRDSEKTTVLMSRAAREIEKLKREQGKVLDVEVLRKSYYNSILHSYDIERTILADQQERIKQQNELENKYRQMEVETATNRAKMQDMSQKVDTVLKATAQGLLNQQLTQQLEDMKRQSELKKDVMLAEAALKFDFIKDKREVAILKKRMLEKYQLGQGTNLEKTLKDKKRYLEDDEFGRVEGYNDEADSEGQGGTYLTRMAKEGARKLKEIDYSLSEVDSELSVQEPVFKIPSSLTKAKMNIPNPSKTFVVRLVAVEGFPQNVGVVKAELKVVTLSHKSIVQPTGILPLFNSQVLSPRYEAGVSHNFEVAPSPCFLIVRFVTIDLADMAEGNSECSIIGYSIMPIYCDAETDEAATKHSKSVYLKRGHFRVPILMDEYDKSDFSYANCMKLPKFPGSEAFFSIGETEKDVQSNLPPSLDGYLYVERKETYIQDSVRDDLNARDPLTVQDLAVNYLNAAVEGGMNPVTAEGEEPTQAQLSDFLLDLMSEVPEELNWIDSRFYYACFGSQGFHVEVDSVIYPESQRAIVTIAHLIPPGGLYAPSSSTNTYAVICEHQDASNSIWLQKYSNQSQLMKSGDLGPRSFLVLEFREILSAPDDQSKKSQPQLGVIKVPGGQLGFRTLGYSVMGLVDEESSTFADGVYQLPIVKGTVDLELLVKEQQQTNSAASVSKKVLEEAHRNGKLLSHGSVIFSLRNTIYAETAFRKIDNRRMVQEINPDYVWQNITLSKVSEWNANFSPILNGIPEPFKSEGNLRNFYKTVKAEVIKSFQD